MLVCVYILCVTVYVDPYRLVFHASAKGVSNLVYYNMYPDICGCAINRTYSSTCIKLIVHVEVIIIIHDIVCYSMQLHAQDPIEEWPVDPN